MGGPAEPDKQRDFPGLRSIEVRDFPGRPEGWGVLVLLEAVGVQRRGSVGSS